MSDLRFFVCMGILALLLWGICVYKSNHPTTYGECYTLMEGKGFAVFGCCGGNPDKKEKCKGCPYLVDVDIEEEEL